MDARGGRLNAFCLKLFDHGITQEIDPVCQKSGNLNVVIDTPQGCRNKYAYDFEIKAYVPITLLRITLESRTLGQLHAETRDVCQGDAYTTLGR
jgi:hypothetical protein